MAAVVVVPEEETAALEAARAEWNRQIRPDDVAEESLVEQMATADVRMKRCARVAEAAMEGDAIEAVRSWEAKRRHRVRRQAQDLKDDPVNVVADLEASSFGCDWLIRRWKALDGSLRLGISWGRQSLEEVLRLLGYAQPWRRRPPATRRRSGSGRWRSGPAAASSRPATTSGPTRRSPRTGRRRCGCSGRSWPRRSSGSKGSGRRPGRRSTARRPRRWRRRR